MEHLKPREKLIKFGVSALTDDDLIAILLRTGSKDEDVFSLAKRIMSFFRHISHFKQITVDDLLAMKGISIAKASIILAALELGRRIHQERYVNDLMIKESQDVYYLLKDELESLNQEHLIVLSIDVKGKLIKKDTVYIGTATQITVSMKELFKSAINFSAYGILIVHNHPSGEAPPSLQDDILTEKIVAACKLLSIHFLDHLIIGKYEYYSYREGKRIKV